MTYLRYAWNTILAFIFAAFLWIIAIIGTRDGGVANLVFWLGLVAAMIAVQEDAAKRASRERSS